MASFRHQCHYKILGVDASVNDEDLKKAYRRLALKYHPDKNQDNIEECTKIFHEIQNAYEVLSDPQERAWYDRHRDEILFGTGSDFKDDVIDLMLYFSSTVYNGFGDDPKGFYSVYSDVFTRIAGEEAQFVNDDSEFILPSFGNSQSDYKEVVYLFYALWQDFSTCRPFHWLNKYDRTQAPNRKVEKLMEKDNRKIRDAAKKKRNETVRQLVAYVRKRDKRVQEYKKLEVVREEERKKKMAERKANEALKRLQELQLNEYRPHQWENEEELEQQMLSMQAQLDIEFGKSSSSDGHGSDESDSVPDLYCPACNKVFKSEKSFSNHEKSKKHKENVVLLKSILKEEDEKDIHVNNEEENVLDSSTEKIQSSTSSPQVNTHGSSTGSTDYGNPNTTTCTTGVLLNCTTNNTNTASREKHVQVSSPLQTNIHVHEPVNDITNSTKLFIEEVLIHNRTEHDDKQYNDGDSEESSISGVEDEEEKFNVLCRPTVTKVTPFDLLEEDLATIPSTAVDLESISTSVTGNNKKRKKKKSSAQSTEKSGEDTSWSCSVCQSSFPSRNKLFTHINQMGHVSTVSQSSLRMDKKDNNQCDSVGVSSKNKKRRKAKGKT